MEIVQEMMELRRTGHSIPEIARLTGCSKGKVWRTVHLVPVLPQYQEALRRKHGASAIRCQERWLIAEQRAAELMSGLTENNAFLVLVCLYWAEGAKRDFTFTNTDPDMIRLVVDCLRALSFPVENLEITARIFEDMTDRKQEIAHYWAEVTGLSPMQVRFFDVRSGSKEGKLEYGMCRLRLRKGSECLKLIQSGIGLLKQYVPS